MRIWACPSNSKINPVTGNSLAEGHYHADAPAGIHYPPLTYRREEVGRVVEIGKTQDVTYFMDERAV